MAKRQYGPRNGRYTARRRQELMWPKEGRVEGHGGNSAYGGTRDRMPGPTDLNLRFGKTEKQKKKLGFMAIVDAIVGIGGIALAVVACINLDYRYALVSFIALVFLSVRAWWFLQYKPF